MRTCWPFLTIFSTLWAGVVHAAPPDTQPAAVYAKVIYVLKKPSREKDRPEPWIAKELTDRGHIHFMAVSDWVRLGDLNAEKSTVIWNGASDWIDGDHHVQACPGFARITERADGHMNVEIEAFLPVVNMVRLQIPDKLGSQTLAVAVKDKIYIALQVSHPSETTSKPVVQNGLHVTVTLPKATFAVDEPLKFTVQFKNVSDKPFNLLNADGYHYRDWTIRFKKQGEGSWGEFGFDQAGKLKLSVVQVEPGRVLAVPVVLEGMDLTSIARILADSHQEQLSMSDGKSHPLKPGKYLFAVKMDVRDNVKNDPNPAVRYWAGPIITEPVEFEVTEKPALGSKPVVKDGLQVTVTLPKTTYAVDEPMKFTVQFKNVSDKPFLLYDADYFWNWRVMCEDQRKIGPWRLNKLFKDQRIRPESKTLKPGESLEVPVNFDPKEHSFEFAWEGLQRKEVRPVKSLALGKYELVIEMTITDNPFDVRRQFSFYWTGQIKTNPVEFEITGSADRKEH